MEQLEDGMYDYCFADIWIGNNDTIPYLKLKKICRKFKKTTMAYWIEDALIETVIGFVFMIILEGYYKNQNINSPDLGNMPIEEQYKFDVLKELLSDVKITIPEQLDYYMDYKNIADLL